MLIGGVIAWYVSTRSKDAKVNNARKERGTLLASGFIAGGALMGVVSAVMRFAGINLVNTAWQQSTAGEVLSLAAYALIIVYLAMSSLKASKEK